MSAEPHGGDRTIPFDDLLRINQICDAFESAWVAGRRPAISDYLPRAAEALQGKLVRDLIDIELFYRRRQGESPQVDAFLEQFPEVGAAWLKEIAERGPEPGAARRPSPSVPLRQFGGYELLSEIARGGMGVVYRARQVSLNRIVAIKTILSGLHAAPGDVERFYAEAEAAALLDHPGIVPIFDVGEYQGQPYFSMGFVDGRTLADRLTEGPLEARAAAELVRTVCEAVQYAHERDVIHRDLKPGNILLDHDGRPRITDFGLAKCLTDDAGRTATGQMLGTPSYMPPEQAAGRLDAVGPAADIYALGAILYALITGRPPFHAASSVDTLRQVMDNEPVRPSDLAPGTPRDLETIALKCLQKPIAQRYASVRDLGDDLQRFLDGLPIVARPVSRWERGWRWCRRNPYLAVLGGAVALLAVISTAAALGFRVQLARAENATQAETVAKQEAVLAKQEATDKLWDSYVVAARAERMSRRSGQRFNSLRAIESALALPVPKDRSRDELRTEAIAAMMLPDMEEAKQWPGFPKGTLSATIDDAFQRYARGGADGSVSVRRVADDALLFQLPGIGPLTDYEGLAFDTGGRHLMQCCQTGKGPIHRIWKLQGAPTLLLSCAGACDFAPDGRRFAATDKDGSIAVYDLESGKEMRRYRLAGFVPDWLLWNPRRPALFARSADRRSYRLLDLENGTFGPAIAARVIIAWQSWHPAGRLLALGEDGSSAPKIYLVDADTGAVATPPLEAHHTAGVVVRFNHYGNRLLSTDWNGLWHLWDVPTGQLLMTLPAGKTELRFSPDDRLVGLDYSPQGVRFFRFESGREIYKIVHHGPAAIRTYSDPGQGACQLDPQGRLLALPAPDGIAVIDVIRGEDVAALPNAATWPVQVDDSGALITHGNAGLLRWPVKCDPASGRRVYGPPRKLAPAMTRKLVGGASDGSCRVLAFPTFGDGARVLLLPEERQISLVHQEDVRHCAVSPDGRWVATGSHRAVQGPGARIWDAKSGRCVRALPVPGLCRVTFSPDGKWLLTDGGGARLWSVGDWNEGPRLGPSAVCGAFSYGGDLLALEDVPGVVRLVIPASGREIARLTVPETIRPDPCFFTRDGSRLVCWTYERLLCVFDLGLIRSKLAAIGLDWDAPPCPAPSDRLPEPVEVKFVGAE